MKYPLDQATFNECLTHIVSHSNMQTVLIDKLSQILNSAMDASEHDDDDWYKEANDLLKDLQELKIHHETRRWNESNYQNQMNAGAIKTTLPVVYSPKSKVVKHLAEQPEIGKATRINDSNDHIVGLKGLQFDVTLDMKANVEEAKFGPEMTEEDLARHFSQKRTKKKKEEPKRLNEMTMDEIGEWERKQDNATDLYKVAARVKNLARGSNASLTEQGEMLCNTYTHVMKAFYDFAEKIEDKTTKISLINLIREQEGMPGTLIAAAGAGVKRKK